MIQAVRGTNDILPQEVMRWRFLEEKARSVFGRYGYEEIRTPIFEETELFIRSVGETTDIVEKQMYTIPEEGGMGITLRPEATAPVVRSFLQHNLAHEDRVQKLFYIGPMFRHERPQKGRLRQFHQIGVEVLGSGHPSLDVEVIDLLSSFLSEMGLSGAHFKVNSVGCRVCKPKYGELLKESLKSKVHALCGNCQRRFEKNVLRVLDCKNEICQAALENIPLLPDVICQDCRNHFDQVELLLAELGVSFTLAPKLVRGLDYYTRTIFEVTHANLGAQDAIAAGGRYDHLVESLGGPSVCAVGFGMGMERMLLALQNELEGKILPVRPFLFLASLGEQAFQLNFLLQKELRKLSILSEIDYEAKSFKSQFRRANKLGVKYVLIRGEDEIARKVVKLKNMVSGMEEEVSAEHVVEIILSQIKNQLSKTNELTPPTPLK
ncbi:MAG: histidine--tRNA ligase [Chlamydiae bacterium]|nr:histidine--tRNA ligase [Chlamydiota bacterium]MBI3266989.1 histidine--tRNA ligase [Chlamydiota bacterium]